LTTSSYSGSGTCVMCCPATSITTTRSARTYLLVRTHRFIAPCKPSDASNRGLFSAAYTTNTHGFDLRRGQVFNKIKHCRRVATRDDLAVSYLAFVQLASMRLWLRVNESAF
jgi:hypothetical protein